MDMLAELMGTMGLQPGKVLYKKECDNAATEVTEATCKKFGLEFKGEESMKELAENHGVFFKTLEAPNKNDGLDMYVFTCDKEANEVYSAQLVIWNAKERDIERSEVVFSDKGLEKIRKEVTGEDKPYAKYGQDDETNG